MVVVVVLVVVVTSGAVILVVPVLVLVGDGSGAVGTNEIVSGSGGVLLVEV